MPKYQFANEAGLVQLQYQPQQAAFIRALAARHCVCGASWQMAFGDPSTTRCPACGTKGLRDFDKMLLLAGRQGGKTRIGTLAGVLEASMPNTRGWVTAPSYRDLLDFVEPAFFAQLPQAWLDEGDWNVDDRVLRLPNGSTVAFRSLDNPQTVRGPELDWWLMDEACQVSEVAHEVGDAMLAIRQGVQILTTTPQGEDWVYEKVYLHAQHGTPGYWAATWKSIDNPVMTAAYIEQKRATMSLEMFAQEYEASIVSFRGAIYGDLVSAATLDDATDDGMAILKKAFPQWPQIDPTLTCVIGLDPGSDHPFAGAFGVITPRGIFILNEYEERERPNMLHALYLKQLAPTTNLRWTCDRSQAQTMLELAQHGIYAVASEGGPGSVVAGIERVKTWMLSGQLLLVKSRCPKLIARLKSYRWADTKRNDGSTGKQEPYKRGDDLPDALRYLLMSWPHLPEPIATSTGRDLSAFDDKTRRDIERMARHTRAVDKERIEDGVGEFHVRHEELVSGSAFDSMYSNW